jgi:hypothetical protein
MPKKLFGAPNVNLWYPEFNASAFIVQFGVQYSPSARRSAILGAGSFFLAASVRTATGPGFLPFRILAIGSNGTSKRATGTIAF